MEIPRFLRHNLNPRLVQEDMGDAFQVFVHEVLRADYPDLHFFPSRGKDGVIDLSQTKAEARTVVECKFIGEDGLSEARRRWREVAGKLAAHLVNPDAPAKYDAQYGPWYRADPGIAEFVFCISAVLSNQEQADQLQHEIAQFFSDLGKEHKHLAHLSELSVKVIEWNDLCTRLCQRPHVLFRWFPVTRPQGLVPLGESPYLGTFRSYLNSARLPYYSRKHHLESMPSLTEVKIPDEEALLRLLEDGRTTGLVVTGGGGVGKTRLAREIAHLATAKGWLVLRVQSRLREDALERLAERVTPDTSVLLLFDYIETQKDFAEIEQTINDLNDTYLLKLCYVASCRTSYYHALPASSRRWRVNLSPFVQDSELRWLESYRHETVCHILKHSGIEVTDEYLAICQDIPIFAVFVSYLYTTGREADLAALLREADFGIWVSKRIQLSFGQEASQRDLALLVSLLPLPASLFSRMDQHRFGPLLDILATDGWVERLPADERDGSGTWVAGHDVLADQIVLTLLQGIPYTAERFVEELLCLACEVGCLRSALYTLQRVADQPPLASLNWVGILGQKMTDVPVIWGEVHDLLIQTSLLTPPQRIHLLGEHPEAWDGAWEETEFQNILGWLARWVKNQTEPALDEAGHSVLRSWVQKAAAYATTNNYILSWGLRLYPEAVREPALSWILTRPVLLQTSYLMAAWLECGFPPEDIAKSVEQWTSRFRSRRHLSLVAKAWLDAGGERNRVRGPIIAWLKVHSTDAEANFVYKAWLNAGGELDLVRDPIAAWLQAYSTDAEARFVYKAWLDAGGELELVRDPIAAWIEVHSTDAEANFVYRAWLDARGELGLVRSPIAAWLEVHSTDAGASFVHKGWLNAGGELDLVHSSIAAWLKAHSTDAEAQLFYRAWLDAGGELDLVRGSIAAWLEVYSTTAEASFVYKGWLDAGGELELVRGPITVWLEVHSTDAEAQFVYRDWLDAGGELGLMRSPIAAWLEVHVTAPEASFVYKGWLDAGGKLELVRSPIAAWLQVRSADAEAQLVYKAWLDAGGELELVCDPITAWIQVHSTDAEADFVYQAWLDAGGGLDLVRDPIAAWLEVHSTDTEAPFVYQAWLDAGGGLDVVRGPIAAWIEVHSTDAEAQFVYKAWLDAGGELELVHDPIAAWLEAHSTDAEARFVYKAWLDAGGGLDLVRSSIAPWLKVHSTNTETQLVYRAWLDAGGELELVHDPIAAWLEVHSTDTEASFVYKGWLDAGGELELVRGPITAWLEVHSTDAEADFVCRAWLEAAGPFSLVKLPAIDWLSHHCDKAEAVYMTKFLARQKDIPSHTVVDILTWCRTFPTHEDAIWRLTQLDGHLRKTDIAEDVIATCEAVLEPLITEETPLELVTRGQITTLFNYLIAAPGLRSRALRDRVDTLLIAWVCNPSSFGTSPVPHIQIQRPAYVQRIVDLLVSGALSITSDREHLERFLQWVNTWEPTGKSQLISKFNFLLRNYPTTGLWDIVEFA